jgi:hypothetical protein
MWSLAVGRVPAASHDFVKAPMAAAAELGSTLAEHREKTVPAWALSGKLGRHHAK